MHDPLKITALSLSLSPNKNKSDEEGEDDDYEETKTVRLVHWYPVTSPSNIPTFFSLLI